MTDPIAHLSAAALLGQIFVGGVWRVPAGSETATVTNPVTERPMADIALGNRADVDDAVAAARAAFPGWAATAPEERARCLFAIHKLILERAELFAEAISLEMGAAITFARMAQVPLAAEHVRVAAENLAHYPFLEMQGSTAIAREPIGVCGLITPWNWPLYQITAKVAPALAAGCAAVLKPSELSPLSALLFAQVVEEARVPAGVFNLVNGTGPEVGEAMSRHPDIDMISLTGSTRAGVLVSKTAAETVKRVTLELGGKSPNLILPDADLNSAIAPGIGSCMRNVGQSCSAPTRMIVPRGALTEVERIAAQTVGQFVVGDPLAESTTHGPIANKAQYDRVQRMIAVGIAEGAKLVCGGPGRPEGLSCGYYARPTVFSEVRPDMAIAQEEIFGPVLVIIPYDTVDEAVAIANDTVYGLGAHVQGTDMAQVRAVARRIQSGQVHVNYPAWDPQAPFGGYKQSGNGREYGVFGMEEFLEIKAILGYGDPA
ncbi:aldehyde dehydrogenase family protein [Rhizorhapis sp. SPR117]|uniref:aldehyde dehydrogenase family protein n=1 Tax=Rhizorhapis sp. SPR117 TaxID=2912611 RepID=UPI001F3C448A|nr:aldehyde dehydrogenase family protein [Rhizorhapis sp. SPR117]